VLEDESDRAALLGLSPLPVPGQPYYPCSPLGDAETMVRDDENWATMWMTATDQAFDVIASLVDLDPPGGEHRVTLVFVGLTPDEQSILPDGDHYQSALQGVGHLGSYRWASRTCSAPVELWVETQDPQAAASALLAAAPQPLLDAMHITSQPCRVSTPIVIHPAQRPATTPDDEKAPIVIRPAQRPATTPDDEKADDDRTD